MPTCFRVSAHPCCVAAINAAVQKMAKSPFDKAYSHLQAFRRKFDGLRDKTSQATAGDPLSSESLRELPAFGKNPGNLRMFIHVPNRLPSMAPLVVALHGCNQTADEYDRGTGWSALADRLGFAVVYPQQQPANNPKNCFSWFSPGDTTRDSGEAGSIRQMVAHAVTAFGVDQDRVFVTGLSAGGAMASVMLATYPEVFAGGAIIAGLPYGSARSVQQAFDAMFTDQVHSANALGNRMRKASGYRGPWPKISIWHGTADPIVKPSNSEHILAQWTDIHGLSPAPSFEETIGGHPRRVWTDASGNAVIESFRINGMAHGVPLGAAEDENNHGIAGPFFLDAGIFSTHHIVGFWRLAEGLAETSRVAAVVPELDPIQTNNAVAVAAAAGKAWGHTDDAAGERYADRDAQAVLDPNLVIAAAFKAAGLPVPQLPNAAAGATPGIAPLPIIRAALRAAGLTRN
jgi:poly(hydroxyalkanoate) depolymerase family esterase